MSELIWQIYYNQIYYNLIKLPGAAPKNVFFGHWMLLGF